MKSDWRNFIAVDSAYHPAKASIRNKDIPVETVLEELARSGSIRGVRSRFPQLNTAEIRACLAYAAELVKENILPLSAYIDSRFMRYMVS
ncbi:MAG: hypothetical protein A2X56_10535 [Nitrospirae bacterium GWC2_57_13]|jgi:uncharacterized protein (DUF433 family)|nr:MAG: hypothetical protein A2X56_10535 [Nitrospirae bacterium GWC2_57_13]OGW46425.1 MAG: hypothetical protein A2X57_03420 [Nitrospirae bacterium GWD2_57_8]HAR45333.1 hypothetical protein [Nitrospiraceae bacterium]HAS54748.1 hypothetical protein [Nitrospiraceae bacterium]